MAERNFDDLFYVIRFTVAGELRKSSDKNLSSNSSLPNTWAPVSPSSITNGTRVSITIPRPAPGDHSRDDWKPIQGTPFIEGSRAGDDGIRRVLEMVCAAVRVN